MYLKLQMYARETVSAVCEEVGIVAPSSVEEWIPLYLQVRKVYQGREMTTADWVIAAVDVATFAVPVKGGGQMVKVVFKPIRKTSTRVLMKSAVATVKRQLGRKSAEALVKEGDKAIGSWVFSSGLAELRRNAVKHVSKMTTIDVTKPLTFMFHRCGASRQTFKSLTGLEARVFMRGDARVVICPNKVVGNLGARFLRTTAENALLSTGLETRPGKEAVKFVSETARSGYKFTTNSVEAWKKHVSAWWLMNASGMRQ